MVELNDLSRVVIGAAIEVHRALGPGLLENAYQKCLERELTLRRISFEAQVELPVEYKGAQLDCAYRLDLWVDRRLIVELKSIDSLAPVHQAQILTYLRLTNSRLGLLINFNEALLKTGIRRIANKFQD